jgi:hypothetical protein
MLDVNNYVVFANWQPVMGTTNTSSEITIPQPIPGLSTDYIFLSIFALDINGNAFFESFQLLFGNIHMSVLILGVDGNPAVGVEVQANATTYAGVGQAGTTNSSGMITFTNLTGTTIGLVARGAQNEIGVDGLSPVPLVTINLLPYNAASNFTNLGFVNGTNGWSAGTLVPIVEKRGNGVGLDVSTDFQYNLQTTSATFKTFPSSKTAYIRYMFQTDEFPGGYFGSIFNDYFVIVIRDDIGGYKTYQNSMNSLGFGAFTAGGATQWYTLELDTAGTSSVEFDVGVSNVVDNLYQSQIIIDKIGFQPCDGCGDCVTCPGAPMCQDVCQNPPPMTCSFYSTCAEATAHCGAGGYPLRHGQKNCNKFQNNLAHFSTAGQNWIWATMSCLQIALVPVVTSVCDTDTACQAIQSAAFASHAKCYVDSGFCSLPASDFVAVITTVGGDLANLDALKQIGSTLEGCVDNIIASIKTEIVKIISELPTNIEQAAINAAKALSFEITQKFFQDLLP